MSTELKVLDSLISEAKKPPKPKTPPPEPKEESNQVQEHEEYFYCGCRMECIASEEKKKQVPYC